MNNTGVAKGGLADDIANAATGGFPVPTIEDQLAANPEYVTETSVDHVMHIFPELAVTAEGIVEPDVFNISGADVFVPLYTLRLSAPPSLKNDENESVILKAHPGSINKLQFSLS